MSKASVIYDRILVELDLLYPSSSYTRIPNPYDLPSNDDNLLRNGYGLLVGAANPVFLEFCNLAYERTFSVVITKESYNTGSDPVLFDDISKALMEDIYKVHDRFYEPDQLAIDLSIVKVDPATISGVEEVGGKNFLSMTISFTFTVRESI